MTRDQLREVLEFLNSIEGDGYGGMAVFEIARQYVRDAAETETPGSIGDWVAYANKLERALEIVAGASTDELKKLQAEHALESWRPPLTIVPKSALALSAEEIAQSSTSIGTGSVT